MTTTQQHYDMTLDKMTDAEIRESLEAILWALELVHGNWTDMQAQVQKHVKQAQRLLRTVE